MNPNEWLCRSMSESEYNRLFKIDARVRVIPHSKENGFVMVLIQRKNLDLIPSKSHSVSEFF